MEAHGNLLHQLAMEGVAETEALASETGLSETELTNILEELQGEGLVDGEGFWYLTDDGESHLGDLLGGRFSSDELDEIEDRYPEFESLDREFKTMANAWQQSDEQSSNRESIDQLRAHHRDVEAYLEAFSESIQAAYESYVSDLGAALERLQEGDDEYYTGTEVDSYHTVWFRWHDDLLRTLGKNRGE